MSAPQTPTTKQVSDNIIAQVSAQLAQTVPFFPKSFIRVMAQALAGLIVVLYKYAGFIWLQLFVRTASDAETTINGRIVRPLREWGALVGIDEPKPASQAELTINVSVTNQTGFLRTGSQLIYPSTGVTYLVTGDIALNAPTVSAVVRASGDQQGGDGAGTIGNLPNGAQLQFVNPLPNIGRVATVTGQVVTGADAEDVEVYRQRILDRFQKRPQGGAYADYEQWGEEAAGVLTVYPYTSECPGQVDIYVESATEQDGIPTNAQIQAALDLIELDQNGLASRRPIGALVNGFPITRLAFDVRVLGLSVPGDLATVRDQIEAALIDYFLSREPYIVGLSVGARSDRITATGVGGVVDQVVGAAGGVFTTLQVKRNGVDASVYILGVGEKAKLGALTYV
jgi:uncharacterized phage protein gp47/JayE